jgi:hypothetical protein
VPTPEEVQKSDARDPDVARVEAEIARTRARVASNMLALRREVVRRADWREWVRRRPIPFIAGAFVVGLLLGRRATPSVRSVPSGRSGRSFDWFA